MHNKNADLTTCSSLIFFFFQIEKNEQIDVFLFIRQFWTDENLRWNKSDYNNVESIHVTPDKIWKPDVVLYNK